jgi:hypothetical protein
MRQARTVEKHIASLRVKADQPDHAALIRSSEGAFVR